MRTTTDETPSGLFKIIGHISLFGHDENSVDVNPLMGYKHCTADFFKRNIQCQGHSVMNVTLYYIKGKYNTADLILYTIFSLFSESLKGTTASMQWRCLYLRCFTSHPSP